MIVQAKAKSAAFTLLELLVVISIIGILVALAMPTLSAFKTNNMAAGTRQLLDDLARARQLALSQRTTVFLVFVPYDFGNSTFYNNLSPEDKEKASKLLDKQLIGYNQVALRSLGDQPGRGSPRIFSKWRTLGDGIIIPAEKFQLFDPLNPVLTFRTNDLADPSIKQRDRRLDTYGFLFTNSIPFPLETSARPGLNVPYIGFNWQGQLVDAAGNPTLRDELIPLALGSASFQRDPATKEPRRAPVVLAQRPPGNATNSYNIIRIDNLTGRARVERQEVQ